MKNDLDGRSARRADRRSGRQADRLIDGQSPTPKATPARKTSDVHRGPAEVRIVGGVWKRSKLPVADKPGLRPTPDRVRETLYNWLGQDLSGWRVLDAFAGTGALGFEAASRGAAQITLLERDVALVTALRANHKRLDKDNTVPMKIEVADAIPWMARAPAGSFDLVLLDPPFDQNLFDDALTAAAPLLSEHGIIYLESPSVIQPHSSLGLSLWKEGRAGAVHYRLLRRGG
ncbi:MAG: 16S rRNA (guanine(966)-N(2))-methyltransferase RsmD [Burkholderiaceae bacterium]